MHILMVVHEHGIGALQLLAKGANEIVFPTICLGVQNNVVLAFTIPTLLLFLLKTKVWTH